MITAMVVFLFKHQDISLTNAAAMFIDLGTAINKVI